MRRPVTADHPLLLYLEAKERKESLLPPQEVRMLTYADVS
jgi:hypothetical protein